MTTETTLHPQIVPDLDTVVRASMDELLVPGVAVGLLQGDSAQMAGYGVTSVLNPLDVNEHTIFQIGSITKTFTATLAMRLVEQGNLNLDAPVRTYLPDLRLSDEPTAASVTMRHLLTHTAGWDGDYFSDQGRGDDALTRVVASMENLTQLTPLGQVWSYNNAAFYLAGRVIEAVAGTTYEAAMQQYLLEPLGMTESFFFPEEVMLHRFVVGHNRVEDRVELATPWHLSRSAYAAGGICSTVTDMLRYARFWLGDGTAPDGTRLLSQTSMRLMQNPQVQADEERSVGLSWITNERDGIRFIGHSGGTFGQIANLGLAPDRGFAAVILTNSNRGAELVQQVYGHILQHVFGMTPQPDLEPRAMDEQALRPYIGRYRAIMTQLELRVVGGALEGEYSIHDYPGDMPPPIPPMAVAFYGEDRFFIPEGQLKGTRGEFLRDSAGDIRWLRMGSRIHQRVS